MQVVYSCAASVPAQTGSFGTWEQDRDRALEGPEMAASRIAEIATLDQSLNSCVKMRMVGSTGLG